MVDARICCNLQLPHEPCIEGHPACEDVLQCVTGAPAPARRLFSGQCPVPVVVTGETATVAASESEKENSFTTDGFCSLQSSDLGRDGIL